MSERIVRFTKDADLVGRCDTQWQVINENRPAPLLKLANYETLPEGDGYCNFCHWHNTLFSLYESCPLLTEESRDINVAGGTEMGVPADQAQWLVENGWAVYPTHSPIVEESPDNTLTRVNALMDQMQLPHIDEDGMKTWTIEGKAGSSHYARPADKSLANDLGLSPDDFVDMKNMGKGK